MKQQHLIATIAGAFIFMIFALYNGYPIVLSGDTSTYLKSAFDLTVPRDRPVFYGLFIRFTSMGVSIWPTMFLQGLILSYVSNRFIRSVLPDISLYKQLAFLLVIALATIASWVAGQLLPDIFTSILFLSAYLYLTQHNTLQQKILLLAIIWLSIVVHFSHYIIATVFITGLLLASMLRVESLRKIRLRMIHTLGVVLIAWLSLFSSNYIGGHGFVAGSVSHVFLMGKLSESGVLKTYLDKSCHTKGYAICNYKEHLPATGWDFVWDANSPVMLQGGWAATKTEYKAILKDIVTSPKYWPYVVYKSAEATMRQVILLNIDEGEERPWIKFDEETEIYKTINSGFHNEINEFKMTRQNMKTLNIVFYDEVYVTVFLLSLVLLLFAVNDDNKSRITMVYGLLVFFLLTNAFATATFGNVLSRLNSRTIWLLPMTNILFIYDYIARRWGGAKEE